MYEKDKLCTNFQKVSLTQTPSIRAFTRRAILLFLSFLVFAPCSPAQTYSPNPQEFTGPFASWVNVKTKYGAKGDGTSDDTQALQLAFNAIGTGGEDAPKVLYLPAGTYRITSGLTMSAKKYIAIVGEDPATTKILWAGATGGIMFKLNGVTYSRFGRITWDGAGKANTAVAHFWDGSTGSAVTHNEHADEVFMNVGHGLRGGKPHTMDAETAVLRCRFIRNTIAGVSIESFNALDWYIWDSYFEDCAIGVTNNPPTGGAGNFHVFHSIFKRSTYADISIRNTMYFSIRDNYSIGSKAFFVGEPMGQNGGPITLQNNVILDPLDNSPIRFGNKGPATLLDNTIRSRDGQTGPVITSEGDVITAGNTFTVSNTVAAKEKHIAVANVVTAKSAVTPTEPALQATPVKKSRRVFELLPGSATDRLRKTIDSAVALTGQRPVIHIRPGAYTIWQPVVVPANADIQFVGDSWDSRFTWVGAAGGEVFRLEGADKVVMENFSIYGNWRQRGVGMIVKQADVAGKQVLMEGVTVWDATEAGVQMDQFIHGRAELHDFNHSNHSGVGVKVSGGKLAIFGGSSSNNRLSYELNGGELMAQDIWYESGGIQSFINLTGSGNFTLNGAKVHAGNTPDSPVIVDNFNGKATFLGVNMNGKFVVKGDGANTNALAMGMQFDTQNAYTDVSPNANSAMLASRVYSGGSYPLNNIGTADPAFIQKMLEQVRNVRPAYKTASGGLFLHRLQIGQTQIGIRIQPSTGSTTPAPNNPPIVTITSPTNSSTYTAGTAIAIKANASDGDGSISKVEFFNGATKLGESVTAPYVYTWSNAPTGTHTITAKATDDKGAVTTSAALAITVSATSTNLAPTVNAGTDKAVTLPTNSVTLTGTASDANGSIASYSWTKQSGPAATLTNATTASLTASGLVAGTYVFRLTVTDNGGATAFDEATVTVNPAPSGQAVVSLTLFRADTDQELGLLTEGAVLNYAAIGTNQLAVRANTNPATVGSVIFKVDGVNFRTENGAPYAIAGNTGSNYDPWTPSLGNHTLVVTPYSGSNGSGTVGTPITVNFSVINQSPSARRQLEAQKDPYGEGLLTVVPNPVVRNATVNFSASEAGDASLDLYNVRGEKAMAIYSGKAEKGKRYEYLIEGSTLKKGVYILKLTLNKQTHFKKVILIK